MKTALRFLLENHRVVSAGAGTGKTHALITQYLHLCAGATAYRRALSPRQICALTFTEKAAAEMRERLVLRLTAICRAPARSDFDGGLSGIEPELVHSAEHLGVTLPSLLAWEKVLQELSFATISTFHSFAAAQLRRYAPLLGLEPDFVLLDEDAAGQKLRDACEELLLGILSGPNAGPNDPENPPELVQIVFELLGEFGFSNTHGTDGGLVGTLCRLHRQLVEQAGPRPNLAAPYQNDLQKDRAQYKEQLLLSLRFLEQHGAERGKKTGEAAVALAKITDALDQQLQQVEDVDRVAPLFSEAQALFGAFRSAKNDAEQKAALAQAKQRAKEAWATLRAIEVTPQAARFALGLDCLAQALDRDFSARKRQESALDFSDLLRLFRDVLADHPSALAGLRQRFQVFLVDEFQDTNPLQAELVTRIVGETGNSPGRLYVVGDRKQSIYDFRGADVAAYALFCERLKSQGADHETLADSYRSQPGVLAFVNELFSQVMRLPSPHVADVADAPDKPDGRNGNRAPPWFVAWDAQRDPLSAKRPNEGQAQVVWLRESAVFEKPPGSPQSPAIEREAQLLSQHIAALLTQGHRPGQIVVLLRRFTHLGFYTAALCEKRVPHYVVRGRGFFATMEIRDLASVLRLLDDPTDTLALCATLRSPLVGLSDETLLRLHLNDALSLAALQTAASRADVENSTPGLFPGLFKDEGERLARFLAFYEVLFAEAERLHPAELVHLVLELTDYRAILAKLDDGAQRLANIERLLERARSFAGRWRAFVRWLQTDPELAAQTGEPGDEPTGQFLSEHDDAVRIMTIHQAKGLEFPTVFLAGCAAPERHDAPPISYDRDLGLGLTLTVNGERRDTLPQKRNAELRKARIAAESARLFYVACTRAKDRLVLLGVSDRKPPASWLSAVEKVAEDPATASLVTRVEHNPTDRLVPEMEAPTCSGLTTTAATALGRGFYEASNHRACQRMPLTWAAEFLTCVRRFALMRLPSSCVSPPPGRARTADETSALSSEGCVLAGTLPQRLLPALDLGQKGRDLPRALARLGLCAEDDWIQQTTTGLRLFLQGSFVAGLVSQRLPVQAALAVTWPVSGELLLDGMLDLVWQDADRTPCALDFHLLPPPQNRHRFFEYRATLLKGLVQQAFGCKQARIGFVFLQDTDPQPRWETVPPGLTQEIGVRLTELPGPLLPGSALASLPVLQKHDCQGLGCEFRRFCHGDGTGVLGLAKPTGRFSGFPGSIPTSPAVQLPNR